MRVVPGAGRGRFVPVEIFGQTSKYPWVEFRSMGVGLGLGLHMIDMI